MSLRLDAIVRQTKAPLNAPAFDGGQKIIRIPKNLIRVGLAAIAIGFASSILPYIFIVVSLLKILNTGSYLVLFQNNTELRPTGGFIGSIAEFTFNKSRLVSYRFVGNIYDKDNEFLKNNTIPAPQPFARFWPKSYMALANANWSPDFAASAQTAAWFYEHEYDRKVDGVVAVNATLVPEILKITGPINLPRQSITVDSANFLTVIQDYVEQGYYQDIKNQNVNLSKQVLGDLFDKIKNQLNLLKALELAPVLRRGLASHEIQLYLSDASKQAIAASRDWAGLVKPWGGQYLYINNANLGGGKSSQAVSQQVSYETTASDGLVSIKRTHAGRNDYPVGENFNYTRLLLPRQTAIVSVKIDGKNVENIAVSQDLGKTVVGFWFDTPKGATKQAAIAIKLPQGIKNKLLIQRQPGVFMETYQITTNGAKIFSGPLLQDKIVGIIKR